MKKIIFCVYILLISTAWSETVSLELIGLNQSKTIHVNSDIVELKLTKPDMIVPNLVSIRGLDSLKRLDSLSIEFSNLTNFENIWRHFNGITELHLGFVTLQDLNFLKELTSLKRLHLYEGINIQNMNINLNSSSKLEYIQIWGYTLDMIPTINNPPSSFGYLDIAWSKLPVGFSYTDFSNNIMYVINDDDYEKLNRSLDNVMGYGNAKKLLSYYQYLE
ncbi:hypothetical protein [Spirochaeta cellobiosiphila]|uniref:hypothetical protein n=1 Tax=Spirochaeta cellobiosiphila TaxID=504483 RepID=UPI0003FD6C35|nr:hypothetical protein [Spirochaeta cellobiosiphila]